MIPGEDLLSECLGTIAPQSVQWFVNTGRPINAIGMQVPTYADPITVIGSFQAIPRALYVELGLDFNRDYATFYTSNPVANVERGISGDYLMYNGEKWTCESNNDWYSQDKWRGVIVVRVP